MEAKVLYQGKEVATFEGDTLVSLIEDNFKKLRIIISKDAGNIVGYTLNRVWIVRKNDTVCELHVIAHGSEAMINYDATPTELVFEIFGIPENELASEYEFELDKNEFCPFSEDLFSDKSKTVGILEGCVNYLAESHGKDDPTWLVLRTYPTLRDTHLDKYVSQLMEQFRRLNIKKTDDNADIFELIEKCAAAIMKLTETNKEKVNGMYLYYYHRTRYYFYHPDDK